MSNEDNLATTIGGIPATHHFRAVQIFRPKSDNDSYEIDREVLERILSHPDVRDKPVAIYSLAGAFRRGKSFMLNLFLRFLHLGKSNEWLSDKQQTLDMSFVTKGGKDRCTKGIWMWDEPFHVNTSNGELVIFLLDTQGTFDYNTSMKNNLLIFALSTLISSVQVFNIMHSIQESDLQHLELFTNYGRFLSEQCFKLQSKPFQHLCFLIRDWSDPTYEGIEGGREVLKDVLVPRKENKDGELVRESITSSFEKVDCYLMPTPGRSVSVRRFSDPPIKIEDVSSKFVEEVKKLVKHLFEDNVTVKSVNGIVVTGKDLINYIIAYGELFEGGKLPDIQPVMEASFKASLLATSETCREKYKKQMEERFGLNYMKPELLDDAHNASKKEILRQFEELPKMGKPDLILQYQQVLSSFIDQEFVQIQQKNIANKKKLKNEIRGNIDATGKAYSLLLEEKCEQCYIDDARLKEIEPECKVEAMKLYQKSTSNLDEAILSEFVETLNDALHREYNTFIEINKQRKRKLEKYLSEIVLDARRKYTNAMDEKCEDTFLEESSFITAHIESWQGALFLFDSSNMRTDAPMVKQKKSDLEKDLYRLKASYEDRNEINKKRDEAKMFEIVKRARDEYQNLMAKGCSLGYRGPKYISREHERCNREAAKLLDTIEKQKDLAFAQKCRAGVEVAVQRAFRKFKRKNLEYKFNWEHICFDIIQNVKREYRNVMDSKVKHNKCNETIAEISLCINDYHQKVLQRVLDQIDSLDKKPEAFIIEETRSDLEKQLGQLKATYEEINEENGKLRKQKMLEIISRASKIYNSKMKEKCGESYKPTEYIDRQHEKYKMAAEATLDTVKQTMGKEFVNKCNLELKQVLEKALKELKKENEDYKTELECGFSETSAAAISLYRDMMDKKCNAIFLNEAQFTTAHEKALENALAKFNSADASLVKEIKSKLKEELDQLKIEYKEANEMNGTLNEESLNMILQARDKYYNLMKKNYGHFYKAADYIHRQHMQCKKEAEAEVNIKTIEKEKGKEYADKFRSVLDAFLQIAFNKFRIEDKEFKETAITTLQANAIQAFESYKRCIDEKSNVYVAIDTLEQLHQDTRSQAIQKYITASSKMETSENFSKIKNDMQKQMDAYYMSAKISNANKEKWEKKLAKQFIKNLEVKYLTMMGMLCEGKYMEEKALFSLHNQTKEELQKAYEIKTKCLFPSMLARFNKDLEKFYKIIKTNNQKHRKHLLRKHVVNKKK